MVGLILSFDLYTSETMASLSASVKAPFSQDRFITPDRGAAMTGATCLSIDAWIRSMPGDELVRDLISLQICCSSIGMRKRI